MKSLGQQTLPLDLIDIGERLRIIDEARAALIAENIQQTGNLRTAIEVRVTGDRFALIAGAHRIRAARMLGWAEIRTEVYEATEDEATLAEIDENLVRYDLNPLDRAVFLATREEVYTRLHPEAKRGGDRRSEKSKRHDVVLIGFAQDTADRSGLTQRTIQRSLKIARDLSAATRSQLAGTALAQKQSFLLALTKISPDRQTAVIERILKGEARTVADALDLVEGRAPEIETPEQKQLGRLMAAWFAAKSPSARKSFRDFILTQKEPE